MSRFFSNYARYLLNLIPILLVISVADAGEYRSISNYKLNSNEHIVSDEIFNTAIKIGLIDGVNFYGYYASGDSISKEERDYFQSTLIQQGYSKSSAFGYARYFYQRGNIVLVDDLDDYTFGGTLIHERMHK